MNFSDYVISETDYKFFESLPKDEKILFIFDLVCENTYGIGSNNLDRSLVPVKSKQDPEFLRSLTAKTINETVDVNLLVVNKFLIFNAKKESLIISDVHDLLMHGYMIRKRKTSEFLEKVFQHLPYFCVYEVIGHENYICGN